MVTASVCAVVMLPDAGVTVTVGVVGFWLVPPPPWLPPPHDAIERATAKRRNRRKGFANRFTPTPSDTLSVADNSGEGRRDRYARGEQAGRRKGFNML
jgi:hypothetical protein